MDIGIVGLGLIGGSLGLDLRAKGHRVLGVSRNPMTCRIAIERGAADAAQTDAVLLNTADVVFLCTPLGVMKQTAQAILPNLQTQAILTDVGSVKQSIVNDLEPLWPNFVGGHPMAGTEFTGIGAAIPHLFRDRPYVLTPTAQTQPAAVDCLKTLVTDLGSRLYECSPAQHDRAVAWISHLPVMVSASLIHACLSEPEPDTLQLAQALASSGFRDTSRVGGGNPELGRMMAQYNQTELLRSLQGYRQALDHVMALVEQQQWESIEQLLATNHAARPEFED